MFEGSEKKIELIFSQKSPSLFEKPRDFWKKIAKACGAEIVSFSGFPKMHSYILSESSLFLWPHRLVLITCGKTQLSKSLIKILKKFPQESIEVCFFQRKNEFFPQIQKSSFYQDLKKIRKKIPGKAYRFGPLHDHHFFLFHSDSDFIPDEKEQTLEILIYESETLKDSSEKNISYLKKELEKAFYGFEIQEHFFKPCGYSLNAIREEFYYSLHISPEESSFYMSFETNIQDKSLQVLTDKFLNIFKPLRFDFIFFSAQNRAKEELNFSNHFSSSPYYKTLDCGYNVIYKNLHKKNLAFQDPITIDK